MIVVRVAFYQTPIIRGCAFAMRVTQPAAE